MNHMDFLFLFNSILLGAGLAMDAFSVSLANGLNEPAMSRKKMICIAGTFAFFQFAMPMIGWIFVHTILEYFRQIERLIPWIAFALLGFLGVNMILEGIRRKEEEAVPRLTPRTLIVQGIATSIDALSVGFTIAEYQAGAAFVCALIIAGVTFVLCIGGVRIGRTAGMRFSGKASVIGGLILIGIGLEIFLKGVVF